MTRTADQTECNAWVDSQGSDHGHVHSATTSDHCRAILRTAVTALKSRRDSEPFAPWLSWFSLLILAHAANAYIGLDGIQTMSVNAFHCLASQGYSFYITRVYSEIGQVDLNGVNNVKAGRAGMKIF
uniref:Uncharacterized protein n=1 Tax=Plectus sambesii TaxID=2011161 RepID=A0A914XAH3_9BILA